MIPLITGLVHARRTARIRQADIAAGLGLSPKAGHTMVCNWEHGRAIPNVGHACGYATLVGHQIIAVRDGEIVGELADLMPKLADLLVDAGLSMRAVAAGLFVNPASIASIIRLAGPRTRLTSALMVLGAVGCRLELVPAERVARGQFGATA